MQNINHQLSIDEIQIVTFQESMVEGIQVKKRI